MNQKSRKKIGALLLSILLFTPLVSCQQGSKSSSTESLSSQTASSANSVALKAGANLEAEIDIYQTTFVTITLADYLTNPSGLSLSYEAQSESGAITVSTPNSEGKINVFATDAIGDFKVDVTVKNSTTTLLSFVLNIHVVDHSPDPTVTHSIADMALTAPVFSDGSTYLEKSLNLSDYFEAADSTVFALNELEGFSYRLEGKTLTLVFQKTGEFALTVMAKKNGEVKATNAFKATLTAAYPNQLYNGSFEEGWSGWKRDAWAEKCYFINSATTDIWGNGINSHGNYSYGYADPAATDGSTSESGTGSYESSLFKAGGTGAITFKIAGNCTSDLKLELMAKATEGEDTSIASFNNWYYGAYGESGFIFRDYFYQLDLSKYKDALLYFKATDNKSSDFGFLNLDEIVTYYASAPDTKLFYEAAFVTNPEALVLDYSDTSALPFPSDLSSVPAQLPNGDFEKGYADWFMSAEEKQAYAIYDAKTDIWNNPVGGTNRYLYGYKNESFANADFHSNLFKASGSGAISFKLAGNSTSDLQFNLMQYVPGGKAVMVAQFNNWFFPISKESGFIFRSYLYHLDMSLYAGKYFYFEVKDYKAADFGFLMIDDIVTDYASAPAEDGFKKAGFVSDPDAA